MLTTRCTNKSAFLISLVVTPKFVLIFASVFVQAFPSSSQRRRRLRVTRACNNDDEDDKERQKEKVVKSIFNSLKEESRKRGKNSFGVLC